MTYGSLCTGIGGLDLALEAFGHTPAWQAECDPACRQVLARHWPDVRCFEDVKEINVETAARVGLVCGGFPCQPHSLAGKRKGEGDARWLWPEFARIIGDLRPQAVFIENVPGLRTSGLRRVLQDLADLGFDAEWDYFFAAEAGAPHRRQRLYLLAYADGVQWRVEPGRVGGSHGPGSLVSVDDGQAGAAADAAGFIGTTRWAYDGRGKSPGRPESREPMPAWVSPDFNRQWKLQPGGSVTEQWRWTRDENGWTFESPVSGVDDGTPGRLDRERMCGNAVVWQAAALAFEALSSRIQSRERAERAA